MSDATGEVTRLLSELRAGDEEASARLITLIYGELRRMAGSYMRRERPGHTIQPTALVNEAYLRMVGRHQVEWQSRAHFFAIAAHTMRRVLLDYARQRHAGKRGGEGLRRADLELDLLAVEPGQLDTIIALDAALERLGRIDPRQSRLIELRFFAGMSVEETAEVMGIAPVTVKREWRSAKAWLHREMQAAEAE